MTSDPSIFGSARLIVLVFAVGCIARTSGAQPEPPASPDTRVSRPSFKPFRYDEDFSALSDAALRTQPLDDVKYIPLADDPKVWLSVGGEARTRYEYFNEPGFGLRGLSRDDFLLQRLLLHTDLHLGEHIRVFAQTISAWQIDPESPRSNLQDDRLDLQQAFGDLILGDPHAGSVTLRIGRQEMSFGSQRLVSAREPANVRLNFDGFRAIAHVGDTRVDAFLVRPVEQDFGVFNDGQNDAQTFWGLYATTPIVGTRLNIDAYYFGLRREGARFAAGVATDERHSVGTRLWGTTDGFDYDMEGVFQFGEFGDKDIRAWTLASNLGYTWQDAAWSPRLGLKANIASGDSNPTQGDLGTFFALFPRQGYFSEINLLSPSNFFDLHPAIQVHPGETVTLAATWDPFWKYDTIDAVYGPRGIAIPAGAGRGRYVGSTVDLEINWAITPQLSLSGFYAHFFAGEAVSSAGGHGADFFGTWVTFKF